MARVELNNKFSRSKITECPKSTEITRYIVHGLGYQYYTSTKSILKFCLVFRSDASYFSPHFEKWVKGGNFNVFHTTNSYLWKNGGPKKLTSFLTLRSCHFGQG